eukprot:2523272-Rhodomonas_salina.1
MSGPVSSQPTPFSSPIRAPGAASRTSRRRSRAYAPPSSPSASQTSRPRPQSPLNPTAAPPSPSPTAGCTLQKDDYSRAAGAAHPRSQSSPLRFQTVANRCKRPSVFPQRSTAGDGPRIQPSS